MEMVGKAIVSEKWKSHIPRMEKSHYFDQNVPNCSKFIKNVCLIIMPIESPRRKSNPLILANILICLFHSILEIIRPPCRLFLMILYSTHQAVSWSLHNTGRGNLLTCSIDACESYLRLYYAADLCRSEIGNIH